MRVLLSYREVNESSNVGAATRRRAVGNAGRASPARTAAAGVRPARWAALLSVLACACSLQGLSPGWDASSSGGEAGVSSGAGATGGEGGSIRESIEIEAENGELCFLYGGFTRMEDEDARGGWYVAVPEELDCKTDKVDCLFQITKAGTYQITARVAEGPEEGTDNSWWIRVNNKPEEGYRYDMTGSEFHVDIVSDTTLPEPKPLTFELAPGEHSVSFGCREDGAKLDWVGLVRLGP
ncbi:hypothetical protein WME99_33155 [Sorangium sp. So ce136]|uniref:hypothetical protein n=1 Tax=Sorangium sp. So ce136 TaxID=3133284 RepID=UPI003F0FF6EE